MTRTGPIYRRKNIADAPGGGIGGGPGEGPPLLVYKGLALKASNPVEEHVIALVEPAAEELGYRLVRVRLSGLRRKHLQIMAERADGSMGLEDCETLSRAISPLLDAADPIPDGYDLEVSSPGIDRPLVRLEDFERFAGHEAKLETGQMIDGRKRFRGTLQGLDGERVKIALAEGEAAIPFAWLSDAKLVLTERLIEEDLKRAKAQETEVQRGEI